MRQSLLRSNQWLQCWNFTLGLSNLPVFPKNQNMAFMWILQILMCWYNYYEKHSAGQRRLISHGQNIAHQLLLTSGPDESQMFFQLFTFWNDIWRHNCSSKTETPVHSAVPVPTPAFFPKGIYVPWLRARAVTSNLPQLGNSAAALALFPDYPAICPKI